MMTANRRLLLAWLEKNIPSMSAGTRIPPDTALARQFDLSRQTVALTISSFVKAGHLVRIRGSGTYRAPLYPRLPGTGKPRAGAVQTVSEKIRELITRGEIRPGGMLPTIKYLSTRWHVSRSTVIAAYRSLVELGIMIKTGRSYWNATGRHIVVSGGGREVLLFTQDEETLREVFSHGMFASAFCMTEDILASHGYLLRYVFFRDFETLCRSWRRLKPPHGLFFHSFNEDQFESLRFSLAQSRREHRFSVVIHWSPRDISTRPYPYTNISQLEIMTELVRTIAHYTVQNGFSRLTCVIRQKDFYETHTSAFLLWDFLWLRAELARLNPRISFRMIVLRSQPENTLEGFLATMNRDTTEMVLSRYSATSANVLARELVFVDTLQSFPLNHEEREFWIFQYEEDAAQLLSRAQDTHIPIPGHLSLVTVGNNPSWYHLGVSRCEIDWFGVGHLMARALMGDPGVPRNSNGALQVSARILNKLTTPALN